MRKSGQLRFICFSQDIILSWDNAPCQLEGNWYNDNRPIDCTSNIVRVKRGNWIGRRVTSGTQEMISSRGRSGDRARKTEG